MSRSGFRNPRLLEFIHASLRVKQRIIEVDEYDRDLRRILNYGHTFGHALEAVTRHEVPHGAAIAWGMDLANHIAYTLGLLADSDRDTIHSFLAERFQCRVSAPLDVEALIGRTKRDKEGGPWRLTLILLRTFGDLTIESLAFDRSLQNAVTEYVNRHSIASVG